MPQIQDYSSPETQGQGPVGGISPNLDAVSAPGRALQNLGQTAEQLSDVFHRRDAAKETSDVYATFAKMRADWTQQLDEQSTNPNFDSQKFQQQYGDQVDELSQKYNTAEGKDFFNKQAARLGGALLTRAAKVQMQMSGDYAKAQVQSAINNDTATLQKDPTQFADLVDSGQEYIEAQVAGDPKLAVHKEMMKKQLAESQAVAALKGYQDQNPGSLRDQTDGAGKKLLDDPTSGFANYLSPKARANIENYFKISDRANDAEQTRAQKAKEQDDKDYLQNVGNQFNTKLYNNKLSPKDVMALKMPDGSDAPFQEKQFWLKQIDDHAKEEYKGNKHMYYDVLSRINADDDDPRKIDDPNVIQKMASETGLSVPQVKELQGFLNRDPEMATQVTARKNLLNAGKAAILRQSMTGTGKDVSSVEKYNLFSQDIMAAEKAQRAANKPVGDVYDPSKPGVYVDPKSARYQTSMQEMQENTMRQMQSAISAGAPGAPKNPNVRQPKESAADFLKRTGK